MKVMSPIISHIWKNFIYFRQCLYFYLISLYLWINVASNFIKIFFSQFTFKIFDYWGDRAVFEEIFIFL